MDSEVRFCKCVLALVYSSDIITCPELWTIKVEGLIICKHPESGG